MADDTTRDDPYAEANWATEAMLKAYAHPLRRRISRALIRLDHARAADLAADLGIPANSVSFHLRVLADAGLIVEAPEHARDRRDRVWKVKDGAWNLGSPEHPITDEVLGSALMQSLAEDHVDMMRRLLAWAPEYTSGRTAEVHGTFIQRSTKLTEAEFTAFEKRLNDLFREFESAHDPDDPDTRVWSIDVIAADDTL